MTSRPARDLAAVRLVADDGISLAEILVAITILAITMAATASSVIRSLQVARDSRESVLAANVVQFELERLRAIPFVDWVTTTGTSSTAGTATATEQHSGPDGQVYEVTRQATWVEAGSTTDGCQTAISGGGGGADYVRVSQTVTVPGRDIDPVTNVTIITPRLDFYDPDTGNLAVYVVDRDGEGAAGHRVVVNGPAGLDVALTDDNGCAFFAYLPVSSASPPTATYDVTIDTPDHIDVDRDVQLISDTATVTAQSTTVRTYTYDLAATIRPVPVPQVPAGVGAAVPATLAWTLHNAAGTFSASGYQVHHQDLAAATPTVLGPLFPYAGGYSLHAGRCPTSDPTGFGAADRATVVTDPGSDVPAQVPLGYVTITAPTDGTTGVNVWADQRDTTTCTSGERLYLGQTDADGALRALVPYGWWTFVSSTSASPAQAAPYTCAQAPAGRCVQIRAGGDHPTSGYAVTTWAQ